jgi:hypothetical protein
MTSDSSTQDRLSFQPIDYSHYTCFSFPEKLFILLSNDKSGCIEWCLDGKAFRILNKRFFVEQVIPKFFKRKLPGSLPFITYYFVCLETSFLSFARQVNVYGFQRIYDEQSAYAYHHQLFNRERSHLLYNMSRKQPLCRRKVEKTERANLFVKTEDYSDSSAATTARSSPTGYCPEEFQEYSASYLSSSSETFASGSSSFDFTDEELSLMMEVLSDDC